MKLFRRRTAEKFGAASADSFWQRAHALSGRDRVRGKQPPRQGRGWTTAQGDTEMVDDRFEEPPIVAAVHPLGLPSAIGALGSSGATSGGDDYAVWPDLDVIDQQAGG